MDNQIVVYLRSEYYSAKQEWTINVCNGDDEPQVCWVQETIYSVVLFK